MKKSKFSEHQIVNILKEYESGIPTRDIFSEHGISAPTFYQWKQKYGGMDAQHFKLLKALQEENSRLKRMFADLSLDHRNLKDIIEKNFKALRIRTDNCPEFISKVFKDFCEEPEIEIQYKQPCKPGHNAYIERFNRTFKEDVLDAYLFEYINQVKALAYEWQIDYNSNHPYKALNSLSPWLFAKEDLVS